MKGFGYQDALSVEQRQFRIHTGCEPDKQKVVCEVFDDGRFLFQTTESIEIRPDDSESIKEDYVKDATFDLHSSVMDQVTVLFHAFQKLSMVKDPTPHYRLGKLFLDRNFYPEAIHCFKNAIKFNPNFIRAYQLLAITYLKTNKNTHALTVVHSVLRDHPDFPDLLDLSGVVQTHLGTYEEAKNAFQKAIKIKPNYLESQFNLGVVLFLSTLSDEDENIVIPVRIMRMLKEIKQKDSYSANAWQSRFTELEETLQQGTKEDIVAALKILQIYFTTKDDSLATTLDFFLIKFMFGGKEITQDEMTLYEKQISAETNKNVNYADYWNELGVVHLIQCRDYFLKAVREFDEAVSINPKYKDASQNNELLKNNKTGFLILLRAILK